MRKYLAVALAYFMPGIASAHTKWFSAGNLPPYHTSEPTTLYLSVYAAIGIFVLGVGYFLQHKRLLQLATFRPHAHHVYDRAAATFAMVVGAFLLIAGTHEYLFSPNLRVETGVPLSMIVLQIAIGLAFLVGVATRTAAMALGLLWLSSAAFTGPIPAIENFWVFSTALFIAIMGNDYFSVLGKSFFKKKLERYKPYAFSVLRFGIGATLFFLGFSEKIFAPEYGMNFLSQYHWNFMQWLGFHFSNYQFVLAAGSVEVLFGLVFMLGIVTRLNALVVAIFFTIPMFILGPIELAGHLPHFAAVVLFLLFGNVRVKKSVIQKSAVLLPEENLRNADGRAYPVTV